MSYIDLHMHSTCSDGTYTPQELVKYAKKKGLVAIAITDHETMEGINSGRKECERLGIRYINGVEINSYWYVGDKKVNIHVLGYSYEPCKMKEFMGELRKLRLKHNEDTMDALRKIGVEIDYEELERIAKESGITRANFAKELVKKGYAGTFEEALAKYLHKGGAAYVDYDNPIFTTIAERIHEAGGIVVLAHPAEYSLSDMETEELVKALVEKGLNGIECIHPSLNTDYSKYMMELAERYHLIMTGGSDFHGRKEEDIDLGVGGDGLRIPESLLHAFPL